jgi:hypothetical protein
MATLSLEFDDSLATSSIEDKVEQLEERVRAVLFDVVAIFIKPQKAGTLPGGAPGAFRARRRSGTPGEH